MGRKNHPTHSTSGWKHFTIAPVDTADKIALSIVPLESADIDQKHIADLVTQLADPDPDKRQSAFAELSQYGPGLAPLLEKLSTDQPPEARLRLKQLLAGKITPALGGMQIIDNRLTVARRQDDGTVLLYAPAGVSVPTSSDEPQKVVPAWLCIRPGGRIDRALPPALVKDQLPTACHLRALHDDWITTDDGTGAGVRRFLGDTFVPLVHPDEQRFSQLIGLDRRGRWLFSDPSQPTQTLILDPTILDPTPRLPVWVIKVPDGSVGWNHNDFPVTKRGGAWALKADTWEPLPDTDPLITKSPAPPSTQSALLTTSDGTKYFDGQTAITTIDKTGQTKTWSLPPSAVGDGDGDVTLIRTNDGVLFLFNHPGRVLRIKPTPAATQPFQLEATFTDSIPPTDHPPRIWLDPLGRIDFVADDNTLVIMFPAGHIPPEIARMMPDQN